jgi:hypothetical protein
LGAPGRASESERRTNAYCDSINDPRQLDINFFVLEGSPRGLKTGPKGGYHENHFFDRCRSIKPIFCLALVGLVASLGVMSFGMDLTSIWL